MIKPLFGKWIHTVNLTFPFSRDVKRWLSAFSIRLQADYLLSLNIFYCFHLIQGHTIWWQHSFGRTCTVLKVYSANLTRFPSQNWCVVMTVTLSINTYTAKPVCWNGWIYDSYCSIKPLCSGMGEVVPARTSPTLPPPSPRTVLSLSCFKVSQCINCRDWHFKS